MFHDLALFFDPATRRCDLGLTADGDLAIDLTSVTPVMMSVGLDRRADADDILPDGISSFLTPGSFSALRGAPTDALDPDGVRSGCKCWLLNRAKETETTRALYAFWLKEGLAWAEAVTGQAAEIDVQWLRPKVLGWRVFVGDDEISGAQALDGG